MNEQTTCSECDLPSDDLYEDEFAMGEMLRTLSTAFGDDPTREATGEHTGPEEEEDFADLLAEDRFEDGVDVDLFERVGSHDDCDTSVEIAELSCSIDSEAESIAQFEEEADFLSNAYEGCRWNDRHNCFSIQLLRGDTLEYALEKRKKRSSGVFINILRLQGYPNRAPEVCIEPWNNILTTTEVHHLYAHINAHCKMMEGTPSLLMSVVALATDVCDAMIRGGEGAAIDYGIEADAALELKSLGLHIRAEHEVLAPTQYLGSIGDLISKLPKGVDVINVENVLRPDLAARFERMQRFFYQKYIAKLEQRNETKHLRTQQHYLKLADIRPAFHGTRMVNVGKIVRSGLLVPGSSSGLQVMTGSRYGCGIYSSPDPNLALSYAERGIADWSSIKLMVCAVLMGKERVIPDGSEPWGGGCAEGFDSHISQDGLQYVVFRESQILPCYVLHLMVRKRNTTSEPLGNTRSVEFATHAHGTKSTAILTQMARKNLPFGFGPKGERFVVEEIADFSDDEEDWGDFQELRHGGGIGHEEYQHETLLPPPPPPPPPKVPRSRGPLQNPNR